MESVGPKGVGGPFGVGKCGRRRHNTDQSHRGLGVGRRRCAGQTSRGTLIELYEATGGPAWANNTGWLGTGPLTGWYGVTTNEDGRHVVGLHLAGNLLSGELPPSMRNLIELEILSLNDNQLTCSIPESLGDLSRCWHCHSGTTRLRE